MARTPNGINLFLALARLSSDLFSHPVWVHFVETNGSISPDQISNILKPVPQYLEKGDIRSACQIYLLCAALQKRRQDMSSALNNSQQAWELAEQNQLYDLAISAAWGMSAIYLCLEDSQHASETLEQLQVRLAEEKEWVLATYVELTGRALKSPEQDSDLAEGIEWLMRWGDPPQVVEQAYIHNTILRSKLSLFLKRNQPLRDRPQRPSFWDTLRRVINGELRLGWIERCAQPADRSSPKDDSQAQRNGSTLQENQGSPMQKKAAQLELHTTTTLSPPLSLPKEIHIERPAPTLEPQQDLEKHPSMSAYCLGQLCVYRNDELVDNWSSRKAQLIFKYLIVHRQHAISKEILMSIFWPDADPEAARRNLHQAIYALRQTLKNKHPNFQPVLFENDCYQLNPELHLWLDFEEFERHSRDGQAYEQNGQPEEAVIEYGIAEGLYRDHFLVEDLYEDWAQPRRQTLWQTYLFISYRLSQHYFARNELAAAIALCRRILTFDNSQEEAHLNLMKCYLAQGQRHLAINQYKLCVQALKDDLDLVPSAETQALYFEITQGSVYPSLKEKSPHN